MPACSIDTPAGPLLIVESAGAIAETRFTDTREPDNDDTKLLRIARIQLLAYFSDRFDRFDLPLVPARTPFQARIRAAMLAIPYGQTRSYGELAHAAGGGPRAVGQACGANPLQILVPCHRVVAASGIGGYGGAGGLNTKRLLLALEARAARG